MKETKVINVEEFFDYNYPTEVEEMYKQKVENIVYDFVSKIPLAIKYEGVTSEELRAGMSPEYWTLAHNRSIQLTLFLKFTSKSEIVKSLPCKMVIWTNEVLVDKYTDFTLGDEQIGTPMRAELFIANTEINLAEDNVHIEKIIMEIKLT